MDVSTMGGKIRATCLVTLTGLDLSGYGSYGFRAIFPETPDRHLAHCIAIGRRDIPEGVVLGGAPWVWIAAVEPTALKRQRPAIRLGAIWCGETAA